MAISLVQHTTANNPSNGSGGSSPSTLTFTTSATGSGNLLVALLNLDTNGTITITPPSGWNLDYSDTSGGNSVYVYSKPNCPSGVTSHAFQISETGGTTLCSGVFGEFSGVATTSPYDSAVQAQSSTGGASSLTVTGGTPAQSGELILAGFGSDNGAVTTFNNVSGWSIADSTPGGGTGSGYYPQCVLYWQTGTASAPSCTGSWSPNNDYRSVIVGYKPAAAAATAIPSSKRSAVQQPRRRQSQARVVPKTPTVLPASAVHRTQPQRSSKARTSWSPSKVPVAPVGSVPNETAPKRRPVSTRRAPSAWVPPAAPSGVVSIQPKTKRQAALWRRGRAQVPPYVPPAPSGSIPAGPVRRRPALSVRRPRAASVPTVAAVASPSWVPQAAVRRSLLGGRRVRPSGPIPTTPVIWPFVVARRATTSIIRRARAIVPPYRPPTRAGSVPYQPKAPGRPVIWAKRSRAQPIVSFVPAAPSGSVLAASSVRQRLATIVRRGRPSSPPMATPVALLVKPPIRRLGLSIRRGRPGGTPMTTPTIVVQAKGPSRAPTSMRRRSATSSPTIAPTWTPVTPVHRALGLVVRRSRPGGSPLTAPIAIPVMPFRRSIPAKVARRVVAWLPFLKLRPPVLDFQRIVTLSDEPALIVTLSDEPALIVTLSDEPALIVTLSDD